MDNNESRLLIRSDSILRKVSADIFESPKAQIRMHTNYPHNKTYSKID